MLYTGQNLSTNQKVAMPNATGYGFERVGCLCSWINKFDDAYVPVARH